jgi:hypothetical protein
MRLPIKGKAEEKVEVGKLFLIQESTKHDFIDSAICQKIDSLKLHILKFVI